MEDHETRRKIIRQWMSLPKDKRQTAEQAAAFGKKAAEENKLQHSRRDPLPKSNGLAPAACRQVTIRVMSPSGEDKLILLLIEIQADIRQMKSDLQSLLRLLKQQQQGPTPPPSLSSDDIANGIESAQSGSPEEVLRYLRETRGDDDTG